MRRLALVLLALAAAASAHAVPTTVVIQGKLENSVGQPLTGNRGYRVRFFDASTVGFQLGSDFTGTLNVPSTGRFSIELTPPAGFITAAGLWYEIAVDSAASPDGVDSSDVFATRVKVNSVPFALDTTNLGGVAASSYNLKSAGLQGAYDGAGAGGGRMINTASGSITINGSGGLSSVSRIESADVIRVVTSVNGGQLAAQLSRNADGGRFEANDEDNFPTVNVGAATGGFGGVGAFRMEDPNKFGLGLIGDPTGTNQGGQVAVFNNAQNFTSSQTVSAGGSGLIDVYAGGSSNEPVVTAGVSSANGGYFQITDSVGNARVVATQLVSGHGVLNIMSNTGAVGVQLTGSGTKSFVAQDPTRADRMIRYVCLEGPEAAMYCRGKVKIANGRAEIVFPPHFSALAAPDSVTVTLTPRSSASRGLAAENVTATGFEAIELNSGLGSYDVDWVAYAVRSGFEEMPVYLDAEEWRAQFDPRLPERATPNAQESIQLLTPAVRK